MSTYTSLEDLFEDLYNPVSMIHVPPQPKNRLIEVIQVPLTPGTERIDTDAVERLRASALCSKPGSNAIIKQQSDHPFTLKLDAMYIRSAHFADRAARRRENWLAKQTHKSNHEKEITTMKISEDPRKPDFDTLGCSMKVELGDDKDQCTRTDTKTPDDKEMTCGEVFVEVERIAEEKRQGLAEIVISTRNFSPTSWDELSYEREKARCMYV